MRRRVVKGVASRRWWDTTRRDAARAAASSADMRVGRAVEWSGGPLAVSQIFFWERREARVSFWKSMDRTSERYGVPSLWAPPTLSLIHI